MSALQKALSGKEQLIAEKLEVILKDAGIDIHLLAKEIRISEKGSIMLREHALLTGKQLTHFQIRELEDIDSCRSNPKFVETFLSQYKMTRPYNITEGMFPEVYGEVDFCDAVDPKSYPFAAFKSVGYTDEDIDVYLSGWKAEFKWQSQGKILCKLGQGDKFVEFSVSKDWYRSHHLRPQLVEYGLRAIDQLGLELPSALIEKAKKQFGKLHREISGMLHEMDFDEMERTGLISGKTAGQAASWLVVANCDGQQDVALTVNLPWYVNLECSACRFSARFNVSGDQIEKDIGKSADVRSFCRTVSDEADRRNSIRRFISEFHDTWETLGSTLVTDIAEALGSSPWLWLPAVTRFLAQVEKVQSAWEASNIEVVSGRLLLGNIAVYPANDPTGVKEKFISEAGSLVRELKLNGCAQDGLHVHGTVISIPEVKEIVKAVTDHQNYGVSTIAMLLGGSKSKKITDLKLAKSQHYGTLSARKQVEISKAIEALIKVEALRVQHKFYHDMPILTVSSEARDWAQRKEPVATVQQPDPKEFLEAAFERKDSEAAAVLVADNPDLRFYLQAALVLVPYGKAAKMAKKVLAK